MCRKCGYILCLVATLLFVGVERQLCAQTHPQDSGMVPKPRPKLDLQPQTTKFKPNPQRAWMMAAVFPGVGQVYNRQYWKLPIVYGGFFGFLYAITWNNKNYSDYSNAYFDLVIDNQNDPTGEHPDRWSQRWQDFVPANVDPATYFRNSSFQSNLKSGKDFYRRNRDLSIILSVVFYLICVADAYVDAQMFDFDVSPDISLNINPAIKYLPHGGTRCYGLNLTVNF